MKKNGAFVNLFLLEGCNCLRKTAGTRRKCEWNCYISVNWISFLRKNRNFVTQI
ncbi:hypothetical protein Msub_10404 [Marinobacter subterrani]|uniref:Uncharacterized protein n=1 Tax=Marinobacter subterrani TaxID=1658765 RepID=A0A0J7J7R9_9GAMM|nr:hypothetical protein Msub_10404 [Marinobacter subterrani]